MARAARLTWTWLSSAGEAAAWPLLVTSLTILLLLGCANASPQSPLNIEVNYSLDFSHRTEHIVHVNMSLPAGPATRELQLPVWNALYQVRDFAQYVTNLRAQSQADITIGRPLKVAAVNKTAWRITGPAGPVAIQYDVRADLPGPFGAEVSRQHIFLNLALLLMYEVGHRDRAIMIAFGQEFSAAHPKERIATSLESANVVFSRGPEFIAHNYDELVDSPVEIGDFKEASFDDGGAHYRIVVDADPADYDMQKLVEQDRKIVRFETQWIQPNDSAPEQSGGAKPPFDHYLFIYHFPRGPAGGGMEHKFSTAISISARRLQSDPNALADVTAHEFFHAWNVKRIRPQCLEPVDYTQEQYCDALWFAEGVTSTVSELTLLRTGFINSDHYLQGIAHEIQNLQARPAHRNMSAEESSIVTWFDKYPAYRTPERSIDYYNKGYILGVLLDLQMREASGGRKSLRDLFLYLDQNFARQGKFYADSQGIRQAVEAVTGADFRNFWERYVAGTDEIPYDDFFRSVGLRLEITSNTLADPGFSAPRMMGMAETTVTAVQVGSGADTAGLHVGDVITRVNGEPIVSLERMLNNLKPGDTLRLQIKRDQQTLDVEFKLGSRIEQQYHLTDLDPLTPQQRARRQQWLFDQGAPAAAN